jgi:hypothetical protein
MNETLKVLRRARGLTQEQVTKARNANPTPEWEGHALRPL